MSSLHEQVLSKATPEFTYSSLPPGSYTRMIRLLPSEDENTLIQCELLNYNLLQRQHGQHFYEALSYVWGSSNRFCPIMVNGRRLFITESLYTALLYLRGSQLERILWVDAISINQQDNSEKSKQIPLMRLIYAQARCVIVWLGETRRVSETLRVIGRFGRGEETPFSESIAENACQNLLQQGWFSRVWVLQEVGVARYISIMCGSVQINGHLFCKGLYKLRPSRSMASISPVAYLIDGALLRSQNGHNSTATLSMGELVTMYRNHKATIQHDKIYALLGLSADGAALTPNYELAWHEVLKQLVEHVFPRCSVETWCGSDLAIIKGKGWVLGYIYLSSVSSEDGQQIFKVVLNQTCQKLGYPDKWETEWSLQASGELIQDGDIICLLEGQSAPSILRLCVDHYTVVTPVVKPKQQVPTNKDNMMVGESQYTHSLCNILLNWRISQAEDKADIQSLSRLVEIAPNYHEEYGEDNQRQNYITSVMIDAAIHLLELGASGKGALHELLTKGNVDVDEESLPWGDTDISGERKAAIVHSLWQQDELPSAWNEAFAVAVQVSGPSDYIMSSILIQRLGEELSVSEEVVKAAAASNGWYGPGIVQQLIEYYGDCLPVTEEVVKTAAANDTWCGPVIMYQLFRHHGDSLPVSEEVVKAAAANKGDHGSEIMQQLFENYGDSLPVTEQVVQTAAANDGDYGLAIMQQLINHCEDRLPVSEEVVEEAANNRRYGSEIMQQLVKHYGDSLPVSEERW